MEIQDVQVTAPDIHPILVESDGECYASPIIGSVTITVSSPDTQPLDGCTVSVGLSRTVQFKAYRPASPTRKDKIVLQRILRKRSIRKQSSPPNEQPVHAKVETLTRCNLWHAPEKVQHNRDDGSIHLNFSFALPLPHNIPATTETVLGDVFYAIKATASSVSGCSLDMVRPIRIHRRLVPHHAETVCHERSFPAEELATELRITAQESLDSGIKTTYSAQLSVHRTITRGIRKTEVRHTVIKELKWRIEEITKAPCISRKSDSDGITSGSKVEHVHQLCEGRERGNWKAAGHSPGTTEAGDRIEIPFGMTIHRSAGAIDDLGSREEAVGLTVSHRLRLDIVTGEDTFDHTTERLVDRRPRKKSFVAFFPLPVHEFASQEGGECAALLTGSLPQYEDSNHPPNYAVVG